MADSEYSPATMARVDQVRAQLRDLVDAVRRHEVHCPMRRGLCIGGLASGMLDEIACGEVHALLEEAIAQLAQLPAENAP